MEHDPHIIEYPESGLYLLDIVHNSMEFSKYEYDAMCHVAGQFGLQAKVFLHICRHRKLKFVLQHLKLCLRTFIDIEKLIICPGGHLIVQSINIQSPGPDGDPQPEDMFRIYL